ncbi:MAG: hypothetical protein FWH03_01130 [Firmicutes bacterium]|nr:hypothetical protein [Bacillota bacterium]
MARTKRSKAASGVYYVLLRTKTRSLFETKTDYDTFLALLKNEKTRDAAEIFAYCLFSHEAHLVVKEGLSGLSTGVMRLCSRYGAYYNDTHQTCGRLFYGRFQSKPLEETDEILNATRVIHRAPLSLDLGADYEYSSYRRYFKESDLLSSQEIILLAGSNIDYKLFCGL